MHWSVLFYVIYLGIPLALLLFFGLYRPKLAPLTLLICPVVDLIIYWQDFLYYEGRPFILLFMSIQAVLTAIPAILIWRCARKRRKEP